MRENLRFLETVDVDVVDAADAADVVLLLETVILFLHDVVHDIALLLFLPRADRRAPQTRMNMPTSQSPVTRPVFLSTRWKTRVR